MRGRCSGTLRSTRSKRTEQPPRACSTVAPELPRRTTQHYYHYSGIVRVEALRGAAPQQPRSPACAHHITDCIPVVALRSGFMDFPRVSEQESDVSIPVPQTRVSERRLTSATSQTGSGTTSPCV